MLFSLGHGTHVRQTPSVATRTIAGADAGSPDSLPISAVVDGPTQTALRQVTRHLAPAEAMPAEAPPEAADTAPEKGAFRYLFPDAAALPPEPATLTRLDALAASMVEAPGDGELGPEGEINSHIPAVFTYLGQFIDHDITANTDRETAISLIDGPIAPLEREAVETGLHNLREGSLGLDSLYGDEPGQGDFAKKLAGLMRHPELPHKMRLGIPAATSTGRPPLPADPAADLLRLGFLIEKGLVTREELAALDPDLRASFLKDGEPIATRAIIGDARNDENLIVAQLHVAFRRLHNRLADDPRFSSFEEARRMTRFHYQWLVANVYLPTICDPAVVAEVTAQAAPLYAAFFAAHRPTTPARMPLPLEFSAAAFRFGHSMVRASYDYNRFFGERTGTTPRLLAEAPFDLLFAFTGDGGMPSPLVPGPKRQIPDNWVVEWDRLVVSDRARRAARKIDTRLAPPLDEMRNMPEGVFKRLAMRNLRRGYRLALPNAQACIAGVNATATTPVPLLTPEEIIAGREHILSVEDFGRTTPLWFYILREAEVAGGEHLGPLGSQIVANTLLGLIVQDQSSYWNDTTAGTRWHPAQVFPEAPLTSLDAMLRFTGQMA